MEELDPEYVIVKFRKKKTPRDSTLSVQPEGFYF